MPLSAQSAFFAIVEYFPDHHGADKQHAAADNPEHQQNRGHG
jgi:hypothetical protein